MSGVVWLESRARELIAHETQKRPRVETGGSLFGFGEGEDLVIAGAYGPGPRARHRRTTFSPHPGTTGLLMEAVRGYSQRRYRYLGSWHSHPGGTPRPSGTDVATAEVVANEPEVGLRRPLMLIQASHLKAGSVELGELRAWRWSAALDWVMPWKIELIDLSERFCPDVIVPAGWGRGEHVLSPDAV